MTSKYVTATELSRLWGLSLNGAVKRIESTGAKPSLIPGKGRGGRVKAYLVKKLPDDVRALVESDRRSLPATVDEPVTWAELPEWKIRAASNRFELLSLLDVELKDPKNLRTPESALIDAFVARYNRGKVSKDLLDRLGQRDPRSVRRWIKLYNECKDPNKKIALIPQYGKRLGKTKAKPEEFQVIANLYLTGNLNGKKGVIGQNKLSVKSVYALYGRMVEANGFTSISYATFWRYISTIPYLTRMYYRSGSKEFEDKCLPSAIRGYDDILADDWWCSDGHTLNLFAYDTIAQKVIRPTVLGWMDLATRKLKGWNIGASETKETVIGSFADGIRSNGYVYPLNVLLDNGKAYKNKQTTGRSRKRFYSFLSDTEERDLRGVFARIGSQAHFTDPYNAKSKPIERFWQVVNDYVSMTFIGYTGRNVTEKPEYLSELMKRAAKDPSILPTLDDVREKFGAFVDWYNNRTHSGEGMCGRSPNEVDAKQREELRTIDESALAFACLHRYDVTVQKNGIKKYGRWYRDEDGYMMLYLKSKVEIAVNPNDLSYIEVYDLNGKYICRASVVEFASLKAESRAHSESEIRDRRRERVKIRKLAEEQLKIQGRLRDKELTIEAEIAAAEHPALNGDKYSKYDDEIKKLKHMGEL